MDFIESECTGTDTCGGIDSYRAEVGTDRPTDANKEAADRSQDWPAPRPVAPKGRAASPRCAQFDECPRTPHPRVGVTGY